MKSIKDIYIPGIFFGKKNEEWVFSEIYFDEKIQKIVPSKNEETSEKIYLFPGAIDSHVHFNDPGFNSHEDFLTGTSAAAAGGFTTIIDMPCTSLPPVTSLQNLQKKIRIVKEKAIVDYAFWGGVSGHDIRFEEIEKLWNFGVVGFKIYTISGMDTFRAVSYNQLKKILKRYHDSNILFAFHAEDEQTIKENIKRKNGKDKILQYINTRTIGAEVKAIEQILESASNNQLHFVHISSQEGAKLIQDNENITWETCPHYLAFNNKDFYSLKGRLKTAPPVKAQSDKDFLVKSLENGTLPFVASDHAGCDFESEKNVVDFTSVYNGIPGIQTMFLYLWNDFYKQRKISLRRLWEVSSLNQAKRFGLFPKKGSLAVGSDADFVLVKDVKPYNFDEKTLFSKGKYSPFHKKVFSSKIIDTYVRGKLVYDGEKITGSKGWGRLIKSSKSNSIY